MSDNINIKEIKDKAIEYLQEQIEEKNRQIKLIQDIDTTKPITEKTWHELCETSLRYSDILKVFVKNMWEDAEAVSIAPNDVQFKLYGFKVFVPTSRCMGVEVDWEFFKYAKEKEPQFNPSLETKRMIEYINLENKEHMDWYTLYQYKAPKMVIDKKYRKWVCWLLWNLTYKNTKIDEEYWKAEYEEEKQKYKRKIEKYNRQQEEAFENCTCLFEKLIPELRKFSENIRIVSNSYYSLKEIKEWYERKKGQKEMYESKKIKKCELDKNKK